MARPLETKYAPDSDRVATFRITHGKLTAFQNECRKRGVSVNQALVGFIDSVIGGSDIPAPITSASLLEEKVTELYSSVESHAQRIQSLEGEVSALKKF